MSTQNYDGIAVSQVLVRAGVPLLVTWLLIALVATCPLLDSTQAPYFDLTQTIAEAAYWLAQSGGKFGAPLVAVVMLTILVTRPGNVNRSREIGIIGVVAAICAGGGALVNENIIKAELQVPRPNIVWLAGDDGAGPLGMTPAEFYRTGNKQARRQPLMDTLSRDPAPIALTASIAGHWVDETGYSFPSGHAYSAMFFAAFFLAIAATYVTTKRIWLFYALLPWALAVCYSRPILRVHTPTDITIGGLQGLLVGLLAWTIVRQLLKKLSRPKPMSIDRTGLS